MGKKMMPTISNFSCTAATCGSFEVEGGGCHQTESADSVLDEHYKFYI